MGQNQGKTLSIQEALSNLSLQLRTQNGDTVTGKVLIGKILTTKFFRRFTLTEIVQKKMWRLQERVQIDKIFKSIFKFSFGNKKDKGVCVLKWTLVNEWSAFDTEGVARGLSYL